MPLKHHMLIATLISLSCAGAVQAQTSDADVKTVIEPVPALQDANIVRAQHIRIGDVSAEEYARLLEEADRVRAFQAEGGSYTGVSLEAVREASELAGAADENFDASYEIQMFEETTPVQHQLIKTAAPVTVTQTLYKAQHQVIKGDTLYSLSRHYAVPVEVLQSANGLSSSAIRIGQSLNIPFEASLMTVSSTVISPVAEPSAPTFVRNVEPLPEQTTALGIYAVLPKDTLTGISKRSCISVTDIMVANDIANPRSIQPGQRLKMPSGHCL